MKQLRLILLTFLMGGVGSEMMGQTATSIRIASPASGTTNSTIIGVGTPSASNAYNSVLMGYRAGQAITNMAASNTYLGSDAGRWTTIGGGNVYVGAQAGYGNQTGQRNVILGVSAGGCVSSTNTDIGGNDNVIIGYDAFFETAKADASNNVIIGTNAAYDYDCSNSIIISAGANPTYQRPNNRNIFLGGAGGAANLINAIAIGYGSSVTSSNSLVLGGTGVNAVNVGIGVTSPTARFHNVGSVRLEGLTQNNLLGNLLVQDANGNVYFRDLASLLTAGSGIAINNGIISNTGDLSNTNELQDLSLAGTTLSVTNDATTVDLSPFLDNTDAQALSLSNNTLGISGNASTVNLAPYLDNTDAQALSLSNNTLSISGNASTVNLAPYLDNTDAQTLSLSGNTLSISGGNNVTLPSSPTYTAGTGISLTGNVITNTGDVSNTNEIQNLTISGNTLSISGGNSVTLPSATGYFTLAANGTDISNTNTGNVGIGTVSSLAKLHVKMGAIASTAESIARYDVGDAANDYIGFYNGTTANLKMLPVLKGHVESGNHNALSVVGEISSAQNSGAVPIVYFDARFPTAAIPTTSTRPLFRWGSYATNYMTMLANGNLALGSITTPNAQLHQSSAAATASIHKFSNLTIGNAAADGFDVGIGTTGIAELRQKEALPMNFFTNNIQQATILANGNMGVGTTTPIAKLHIDGGAVLIGDGNTLLPGQTNPNTFPIPNLPIEDYGLIVSKGEGILATGVKVALKNSSEWYDNLDKLIRDLEYKIAYFEANKHLPGIASADELVANGIDVKVVLGGLVKEMEETLLFLKDLRSQSIATQNQVTALQKEVEELKTLKAEVEAIKVSLNK